MKHALDGRFDDGIMKFPHSSNSATWKNDQDCKDRRGDLLPYYFDPNTSLKNESVIRNLIGEVMLGINNGEKWKQVTGREFQKIKLGQVNT